MLEHIRTVLRKCQLPTYVPNCGQVHYSTQHKNPFCPQFQVSVIKCYHMVIYKTLIIEKWLKHIKLEKNHNKSQFGTRMNSPEKLTADIGAKLRSELQLTC